MCGMGRLPSLRPLSDVVSATELFICHCKKVKLLSDNILLGRSILTPVAINFH